MKNKCVSLNIFLFLFFLQFIVAGLSFSQITQIITDQDGNIQEFEYSDQKMIYHVMEGGHLFSTVVIDLNEQIPIIVEFESPPLAFIKTEEFGFAKHSEISSHIENEHQRFKADLSEIISRTELNKINSSNLSTDYLISHEFRNVFNGMALSANRWLWNEIENLPYVINVYEDSEIEVSMEEFDAASHVEFSSSYDGLSATGKGVVIGIVDSGIDYTHPDLGGGIGDGFKVLGGYDFVNNNNDPMDDHGHGTMVAGVAAANGEMLGLAPEASLRAYKVLDQSGRGLTSNVIAGIEQAVLDGVNIINLSLGSISQFGPHSQAIDNATTSGVICVASAGNAGPDYSTTRYPGSSLNSITVGAVDFSNVVASFSSRGPTGNQFLIKPDLLAPGVNYSTTQRGGGYRNASGTSISAPYVAGAAALLLELNTNWTPKMVKSVLMNTADDLGYDVFTQGAGRINILKATGRKSAVKPGSISFGLVDLAEPVWSTNEVLLIKNLSESEKNFQFDVSASLPPGININLSHNNLHLEAGEGTEVLVSLVFDKLMVPFLEEEPHSYSGHILTISEGDTSSIPFAMIHRPYIDLRFEERPFIVLLHDQNGNIINYRESFDMNLHKKIPIPTGTYDLMAMTYGGIYTIKENIEVEGFNKIVISKSNKQNEVSYTFIDTYGHDLVNATFIGMSQLYHESSRVGIMGPSGLAPSYFFSDFSDEYLFQWVRRSIKPINNNTMYVVADELAGLNKNMSKVFNPIEFSKLNLLFDKNLSRNDIVDIDIALGYRSNYLSPSCPTPAVGGKTFIIIHSDDYRKYRNESSIYFSNKPSDSHSGFIAIEYDSTRLANMIGGNHHFIEAWSPYNEMEYRRKINTERDVYFLNMGPIFFVGLMNNDHNKINLMGHRMVNGRSDFNHHFFKYQFHDWNSRESLKYILYNDDKTIKEGFLHDKRSGMIYEFPVEPNKYHLMIENENYKIDGNNGNATIRLTFDTRKEDSNPPHMNSLNITSNGTNTDRVNEGNDNKIKATIYDDKSVEKVQIFIRHERDSLWNELDYSNIDSKYTASIPDNQDAGNISMKIIAIDQSGNILDYTLEPAFIYGINEAPSVFNLKKPVDKDTVLISLPPKPLQFSWGNSIDPDGDLVTYSFYLQGPGIDTTVVNIKDTNLSLDIMNALVHQADYYWTVISTDEKFYTASPDTFVFHAYKKAPVNVSLQSPENGAINVALSPEITWDKLDIADYYTFQLAKDDEFQHIVISEDSLLGISYAITDTLQYQTKYYWRVRGVNVGGIGKWSDEWSFKTIIKSPEVVVLSSPSDGEEGVGLTPLLKWEESERADVYDLQLSDDSEFSYGLIDTTNISKIEIQINEELEKGITYYWRVRAGNEGGYGDWSDALSFTTVMPTDVLQEDVPEHFALEQNYPNPFNPSTKIRFAVPEQAHVRLLVYNMLGQRVSTLLNESKSPGWHDVTFDATGLSSGLYIYRLEADEYVETKSMVFMK